MLVTYRNISANVFELEIYGRSDTNEYVAVGFSSDNKMVIYNLIAVMKSYFY